MTIGVVSINNANSEEQQEISTYINSFIDKTKNDAEIDYTRLFISSLKNNLSIAVCLWFAGLTVIGIFGVYALIGFRGFTFGYSISSIIATLGVSSRYEIYFIFDVTSKYNFHSSIICTCDKWHKTV